MTPDEHNANGHLKNKTADDEREAYIEIHVVIPRFQDVPELICIS